MFSDIKIFNEHKFVLKKLITKFEKFKKLINKKNERDFNISILISFFPFLFVIIFFVFLKYLLIINTGVFIVLLTLILSSFIFILFTPNFFSTVFLLGSRFFDVKNKRHYLINYFRKEIGLCNESSSEEILDFNSKLIHTEYKFLNAMIENNNFNYNDIVYDSLISYINYNNKDTLLENRKDIFELIDSIENNEYIQDKLIDLYEKETFITKYKNEKLNDLNNEIISQGLNKKTQSIKKI